MASPIPYMQFSQPTNAIDVALKTALSTYQGINEGKGQKIQNQLNQAKVPYAGDIARYEAQNAALAPQMTQEQINQLQMQNKYYPRMSESTIAHNQALNNQISSEIEKTKFLLDNPGLMGGAKSKDLAGQLLILEKIKSSIPKTSTGMVDVETGAQGEPSGPSYSREDILGPSGMQDEMYQSGMINQQPSPYQAIEKAIYNNIQRMGMQPWEIKGMEKSAEQQSISGYKAMTELNTQAEAANLNMSALQNMNDAFKSVDPAEIGWIAGHFPARSKEAQEIDQMGAELLQQAQAGWTGSLSDTDISNIKKQFPSRATPEAFESMSDYVMAANARVIEHQQFVERGLEQGIDINKLESAWQKYSNENSVYDEVKRMHDLEKKAAQ